MKLLLPGKPVSNLVNILSILSRMDGLSLTASSMGNPRLKSPPGHLRPDAWFRSYLRSLRYCRDRTRAGMPIVPSSLASRLSQSMVTSSDLMPVCAVMSISVSRSADGVCVSSILKSTPTIEGPSLAGSTVSVSDARPKALWRRLSRRRMRACPRMRDRAVSWLLRCRNSSKSPP